MPYPSPADEQDDAVNVVLLVVLALMILVGIPATILGW